MFSDVLFQIIEDFHEHIHDYNDVIGREPYPKKHIIKILKQMIFLRFKSDTCIIEPMYTDEVIMENALIEAKLRYKYAMRCKKFDISKHDVFTFKYHYNDLETSNDSEK